MSVVVVGIPTYRRPAMLRALLDQVLEQAAQAPFEVSVVVADNACESAAEEAVRSVAAGAPVPVHYRAVPERGISQARNALVRAAAEVAPGYDYLVMYDDDGRLRPGCLAALVEAARTLDADAAGGPVDMGSLSGESRLVQAYLGRALPRHSTGPVETLNGAQNTLLAHRLLDRIGDPWFSPQRGLSGGEDFAFFLRARELGARMVWADEAVVDEPLPPQRLTRRAVLHRAFAENAANTRTEVDVHGAPATLRAMGRSLPWPVVLLASSARHRDPDRLADAAVSLWGLAGRVAGMLGIEPEPYR